MFSEAQASSVFFLGIFSLTSPEQLPELSAIDRIRLIAIRQVNDAGPPVLGELGYHYIRRRPAAGVPIEHDGDETEVRAVRAQELDLLVRDRGAHERHGRDPLAVEPDRAEVPLAHHQVPALPGPVQVEQLELLPEPLRQLVLALPFGKVLVGPRPAAGVRDELARPDCGSGCRPARP